jgi:hypothetical protein
MTTNINETIDSHWHQQPWVWFIIFLLASSMIASFAMLYVATTNAPELVVSDYANIEKFTEHTRNQDRRAAELNISGNLSFEKTAGGAAIHLIVLDLQADGISDWPGKILVRTVNSTTASLDTHTELLGSDGHYEGVLVIPDNAYDLHIEDPMQTWRLSRRLVGNPTATRLEPFRPAS